jgi:hypothetical protein
MDKSVKKRKIEKDTLYGGIKETTIGGFFISRSYRYISD